MTRFVHQLEYNVAATPAGTHEPDWQPVTRFDHNTDDTQKHDIRDEGLHLDIYKDGEKYQVKTGFPTVELSSALDYCKRWLRTNAADLLERFK